MQGVYGGGGEAGKERGKDIAGGLLGRSRRLTGKEFQEGAQRQGYS